jgi:DNA-directed RNA polymerase I, II, and III subunit RPABC5
MLIPVKCFTCGKKIGDKYEYYLKQIEERSDSLKKSEEIEYLDENKIEKTIQGIVLDELHLKDMCCRRHFLTHVNML